MGDISLEIVVNAADAAAAGLESRDEIEVVSEAQFDKALETIRRVLGFGLWGLRALRR